MGKFKEIQSELNELSTTELTVYYERLKYNPSKGVMDELYQELYAQELDRREKENEVYSPYWGA